MNENDGAEMKGVSTASHHAYSVGADFRIFTGSRP